MSGQTHGEFKIPNVFRSRRGSERETETAKQRVQRLDVRSVNVIYYCYETVVEMHIAPCVK